ncbi:lysozyme inhibitor LprI family protein [Variovorax humicola]|uniref:Lysozyme inhibitor LprI family protein n=1 Tax=Variovorax humicola TaxID=1769758 RepID=A0ABU8VS04_9BURK
MLAKREAERVGGAPVPTSAPSPTSAESPAGTPAPEQQASAGSDYEAADKALNAAYAAAGACLDDAGKAALRDERRAWIKARDATCSEAKITADSKGEVAGVSAMVLEVTGCKTKLIKELAKQLAAKG